ncbi:MAG TPA: cytochrome C [Desulfobulbus sp.]|nr:cytochrome C [Desulfobulbus sp.]
MYDSDKIIPGLIIFVLFITFPVWYNHGDASAEPKPELPKGVKECVLPVADMRAEHMQLLNKWRDEVLRDGDWAFDVKVAGKKYQKSLMNTCMECHKSRKKFCEKCHKYASVTPYCWDCHFAPVE